MPWLWMAGKVDHPDPTIRLAAIAFIASLEDGAAKGFGMLVTETNFQHAHPVDYLPIWRPPRKRLTELANKC